MIVGIGNEDMHFHFWEFGSVWSWVQTSSQQSTKNKNKNVSHSLEPQLIICHAVLCLAGTNSEL
jgi:hypothetical protein